MTKSKSKRRAHARATKKRRRIVTKRNPDEAAEAATALFETFHKRPPGDDELREITLEGPIPALVVGELAAVVYRSGIGELFTHEFESSPRLFVSYDGHQLFIVGGNYQFTAHGIEG
jgi:hypothetical protein